MLRVTFLKNLPNESEKMMIKKNHQKEKNGEVGRVCV